MPRTAGAAPWPAGVRHGTERGYAAHIRTRAATCQKCKDAHAKYIREVRARRRARVGRDRPRPGEFAHATNAGYHRHKNEGSDACQPCKDAHNEYILFNRIRRVTTGRSEAVTVPISVFVELYRLAAQSGAHELFDQIVDIYSPEFIDWLDEHLKGKEAA